jgi:tetratricopeptide (TPR) repeat protein
MKNIKLILTAAATLIFISQATANDEKFIEAMQKNIKSVYEAKEITTLLQTVNSFERIAATEKNKWEPFYYIGFGYLMMANIETDGNKKDAYLDKALDAIEKGKVIIPSESELIALEGFAYMLKVTVDPQSRGMVFAPKAVQTYEKALALNPENPRALALLAQMQYGTAQFFGSPPTDACASNAKALEKFQTYKSENPLAPVWGLRMAESLKQGCK